MNSEGQPDRRRYVRYPAMDSAIVALKPHAEILGQMIDISLTGLSFRYIDTDTVKSPSSQLIILMPKPRFFLDGIPFRSVSDFELKSEFSFSTIPVRRRCVAFGKLDSHQQTRLEDFILFCSIMNQQPVWMKHYPQQSIPAPQPV